MKEILRKISPFDDTDQKSQAKHLSKQCLCFLDLFLKSVIHDLFELFYDLNEG